NKQVTRERALENAQTAIKKRSGAHHTETVVVNQDVNMEKKTTPSGSEEAQSNLQIEEARRFVISLFFFTDQLAFLFSHSSLLESHRLIVVSSFAVPVIVILFFLIMLLYFVVAGGVVFCNAVPSASFTGKFASLNCHFVHTLMNNGTKNTMQHDRFIEVAHSKKKKNKKDKQEKRELIVRNGHFMTTRLDNIFLDDSHIWMYKKSETKFENSDHLLEIVANLRDKESTSDWDYYKVQL
ncbi:17501_t:CDS:2, partial [Gigaspora rosea]